MKPTSEPIIPSSPNGATSPLDLAVRAAFLEAFARELVRDTGIGQTPFEDLSIELGLPENGFRSANRMAGLC